MGTSEYMMIAWAVTLILCVLMGVFGTKYKTDVTYREVPKWKMVAFAVPSVIIIAVVLLISTFEGKAGDVGSAVLAPSILSALALDFVLYILFVGRPACKKGSRES